MPSSFADLVKISTATLGTGAITLGDAVPNFQGKAALIDGLTYSYVLVQPDGDYEGGRGTYDEDSGTLSRDDILFSSASNNGPITLTGQAVANVGVLFGSDFLGWIGIYATQLPGLSQDVVSNATPVPLQPGYNGVANKSSGALTLALPTPGYDGEIVEAFDESAYVPGSDGAAVFNWTIKFGVATVTTITTNGGKRLMRWSDTRDVWLVLP